MNLLVVHSRHVAPRSLRDFDRRVRHGGWVPTPVALQDLKTVAIGDYDDVAIAGGDGTVNACLLTTGTAPVLVVPCGTGNDLARALGIDNSGDSARALRCGTRKKLDFGYASGEPFINGVGVGLDGVIAKRHSSGLPYAVAAIGAVARLPTFHARITVNGVSFETDFLSLAIANGPWSGGGFRTAPSAVLDDALLDLVITKPVTRKHFLGSMMKVRRGEHVSDEHVLSMRGNRITVESDQKLPWHLDGEYRSSSTIEITLVPKARFFYTLS